MSDKEEEVTEIYEVERIEKKRIEANGDELFFIKWKDYPGECVYGCGRSNRFAQPELTASLHAPPNVRPDRGGKHLGRHRSGSGPR